MLEYVDVNDFVKEYEYLEQDPVEFDEEFFNNLKECDND